MKKQTIKKETDALIYEFSDEISWDDLMYRIYVRQKIEKGLKYVENGRVYTTEQIKQKFNIGE